MAKKNPAITRIGLAPSICSQTGGLGRGVVKPLFTAGIKLALNATSFGASEAEPLLSNCPADFPKGVTWLSDNVTQANKLPISFRIGVPAKNTINKKVTTVKRHEPENGNANGN